MSVQITFNTMSKPDLKCWTCVHRKKKSCKCSINVWYFFDVENNVCKYFKKKSI